MTQGPCQLISLVRGHIDGEPVRGGQPIWRSIERGRELIDQRLCRLPTPTAVGPEAPPGENPEKKLLVRKTGYPLDRFSFVDRVWEGMTVVCIAGGASVTPEQIECVRAARSADRCRVIAINTSYEEAPWADALYFADAKWWSWHRDKPVFKEFAGQKCSVWVSGNAITDEAVHMLRVHDQTSLVLSNDPEQLATCSNSGHQVVNMAALSGAAVIPLIGYDAKAGPGGRKHHHGDHPDGSEAPYQAMLSYFPRLAHELQKAGIKAVNCSSDSALKCFPRAPIEELLAA